MLDYLGRLIHPSDEQTSEFIRAALHSSPGDYQPVAIAGALTDPVFTTQLPTPSKASYVKSIILLFLFNDYFAFVLCIFTFTV